MKIKILLILGIVCLGLGVSFRTQAGLYRVEHVAVSAESTSSLAAKEAALAAGQVKAFEQLMERLAPQSFASLPQLAAEDVLPYVTGVSIENEKTTSTKYMGSIAVEFNPALVKAFLKTSNVTYLKASPPTLLVVPEYEKEGEVLILDVQNPLYAALKRKEAVAPFYQAVVPVGTEQEQDLSRQGIEAMTALLPAYSKERLMRLRLSYEGEDMWQISSSFLPSQNMQQQSITKRFRFSSGDPVLAAGQMADALFKSMEANWRNETTSSLSSDQTLYLRIAVDSLEDWLAVEKEIKTWAFFEKNTLRGVFLPQVLVEVVYNEELSSIQQKLHERGWHLNPDFSGAGATLTRIYTNE